jgi:hypothetical protein
MSVLGQKTLLIDQIVFRQLDDIAGAPIQQCLGGIERGAEHLLGLDFRRHHQFHAVGHHISAGPGWASQAFTAASRSSAFSTR